jgi:hypothetical protein
MTMNHAMVWLGLLGLGAAHGANPAMGWLFAVGIGLQERSRQAVWRALGPLALGHALAIGMVLAGALAVGAIVPMQWVKWLTASALIGCGIFHGVRHRHPRYGGMRMTGRELTMWSFLMASAHGAGLMLLPLVLHETAAVARHHAHAAIGGMGTVEVSATLLHTLGYLGVTTLIAVIVYEKLGLRILRRAWLNLNVLWVCALIAAGLLTLIV